MREHPPYYWLKNIESTLKEAKLIPSFGNLPVFPDEEFGLHLAAALGRDKVRVETSDSSWQDEAQIEKLRRNYPIVLSFSLAPFDEYGFFVMKKSEASALVGELLTQEQPNITFMQPALNEGFLYFAASQATTLLNQMQAYGDLTLRIEEQPLETATKAFVINLALRLDTTQVWGKLILPEAFMQKIRAHFLNADFFIHDLPVIEHIELPIKMIVGNTQLSMYEWQAVRQGDFVILDRCTIEPEHFRGSALLSLMDTPLFQIKLRENETKITDYAFFQEGEAMLSDENFEDEEETEEVEEMEEPEEEIVSPHNKKSRQHLWSAENGDHSEVEKTISTKQIPMTLSVEIGQISMPLKKLLELKPGNVIDLQIRPEEPVALTIKGKKVAEAELVKLGDVLGAKILKIGSHR